MARRPPIELIRTFVRAVTAVAAMFAAVPAALAQGASGGESYPGIDGFLGTRASVMLDVVALALFIVLPAMAASVYLVRYRRAYALHKTIQLVLGATLLVAVLAFEIDMHYLTEWELRAEPSPYFSIDNKWSGAAGIAMLVHLLFAVPTAVIWTLVIVQALRKFPSPPRPTRYSGRHRLWGWIAVIEMTMTALTGWLFYYLAFVAV